MSTACSDHDAGEWPDDPVPGVDGDIKSSSILIYAVASNNLSSNFRSDMDEMLEGLRGCDWQDCDVMVYSVTPEHTPKLQRVVDGTDGPVLQTVITYDNNQYSTDPRRISKVIADYSALSKAKNRGLILWSHATGWLPQFSTHEMQSVKTCSLSGQGSIEQMELFWFGADQYKGETDFCDINEMAGAIPDGMFNYIWFDCCYMSSIEVFYQLRNKAEWFVAYPTEILAEGMPYDITMPYLVRKIPDILGAAKAEADYFLDGGKIFTVAVVDGSQLETVADVAASLPAHAAPTSTIGLLRYSRNLPKQFYDLGTYLKKWGLDNDPSWDADACQQAMDKLVVYKAASAKGFNNVALSPDRFNGVSTYNFTDDGSPESEYYKTLDWYDRVFGR